MQLPLILLSFQGDSLVFNVRCERFANVLQGLQGDLFDSDSHYMLANHTAMCLVADNFRSGINIESDKTWLDKPLMVRMANYQQLFSTPEDRIIILNQGSMEPFALTPHDLLTAKELVEKTPDPQRMIVSGVLDLIAHQATRVDLVTSDQRVKVLLDQQKKIAADLPSLHNEKVTISGMAHYRPDGSLLRLDGDQVRKARPEDEMFEIIPRVETMQQQIDRQKRDKKQRSKPFQNMLGSWPGDESYEDILAQLD